MKVNLIDMSSAFEKFCFIAEGDILAPVSLIGMPLMSVIEWFCFSQSCLVEEKHQLVDIIYCI